MLRYPTAAKGASDARPKSIIFCEGCGVGIAVPLWSDKDIEKLYSDGLYWNHSSVEVLTPRKYPVPYALANARWKMIERFFQRKDNGLKILDFGAGHGFFGMAAAESTIVGLKKYACVERDRILSESLEKTWAIRFPAIPLEITDELEKVDDLFDCIIVSQVLEHVVEPRSLIRLIFEKLSPGGLLFIDVPNQDHLFKEDVFPHLYFFNLNSLNSLLAGLGLNVKMIDCFGNDMHRSPLNKNVITFYSFLLKILMRIRAFIPISFLLLMSSRCFDISKRNNNGIWIRAICQRPSV